MTRDSTYGLLLVLYLASVGVISSFRVPGYCMGTPSRQARISSSMSLGSNDGGATNTRRGALKSTLSAALAVVTTTLPVGTMLAPEAQARKAGVNRPDLLPKEQTNVIDLVNFLTKGEEKRMNKLIGTLEAETGYRLRVLCQHYPDTPGLAVKDYWKVDDKTIVMVADKGPEDAKGGGVNLLNFNVGDGLRLNLPSQFWQRLQNRYGNRFYVKENGETTAVMNAFESIVYCLRSPSGFCVDPPDLKKAAREASN